MHVAGIDLAWGTRRPDGVCVVRMGDGVARLEHLGLVHGDDALVALIHTRVGDGPALLAVDAPLIVPNRTGARPVDRLTHRLFHREHAGCHPANRRLVTRPPRLSLRLARAGFVPDPAPDSGRARRQLEVYPHLACIRFFGLARILKYKRGPVAARTRALNVLRRRLAGHLVREHPALAADPGLRELLRPAGWTKDAEDLLDAVLCACVGLAHAAGGTEVLGDARTGFLVLPRAIRDGALRAVR